jgi:hypothetical protein
MQERARPRRMRYVAKTRANAPKADRASELAATIEKPRLMVLETPWSAIAKTVRWMVAVDKAVRRWRKLSARAGGIGKGRELAPSNGLQD